MGPATTPRNRHGSRQRSAAPDHRGSALWQQVAPKTLRNWRSAGLGPTACGGRHLPFDSSGWTTRSRAEHDEAVTSDDLTSGQRPRRATTADAAVVAQMLHDFNSEFATPTPGTDALRSRLSPLLAGDDVVVLLVGEPASGLAVLSFRLNVWYEGPVAVLDELYVRPGLRGHGLGSALLAAACDLVRGRGGALLEINVDGGDTEARRFYEVRGFTDTEPNRTDPMLYYYQEL